jgi:hypothetical protein
LSVITAWTESPSSAYKAWAQRSGGCRSPGAWSKAHPAAVDSVATTGRSPAQALHAHIHQLSVQLPCKAADDLACGTAHPDPPLQPSSTQHRIAIGSGISDQGSQPVRPQLLRLALPVDSLLRPNWGPQQAAVGPGGRSSNPSSPSALHLRRQRYAVRRGPARICRTNGRPRSGSHSPDRGQRAFHLSTRSMGTTASRPYGSSVRPSISPASADQPRDTKALRRFHLTLPG